MAATTPMLYNEPTLISMSSTFVVDRRIGRPTSDGKMCAGKFEPEKPHLTNCKVNQHNNANKNNEIIQIKICQIMLSN